MNKRHTRRQILEAIKHWQNVLKEMDESQKIDRAKIIRQHPDMPLSEIAFTMLDDVDDGPDGWRPTDPINFPSSLRPGIDKIRAVIDKTMSKRKADIDQDTQFQMRDVLVDLDKALESAEKVFAMRKKYNGIVPLPAVIAVKFIEKAAKSLQELEEMGYFDMSEQV